ncbi:MAG TPA: hypothetical protein VMJ32_16455 [Pirellulales bacterium]|nr:hypothetical protein [Pirellulales bacterium]
MKVVPRHKFVLSSIRSSLIMGLVLVSFGTSGLTVGQAIAADESCSLKSPKPDGVPIQVAAKLEVGGQLKLAAGASTTSLSDDNKIQSVPMSVVAQFAYDEQRLDDGSSQTHRLAIRRYDDAQAVIKIASKITKPQLRDNRKLIAAVANEHTAFLSAPAGPLTRDELELIDVPANTLILDELLPQAEVEVGHRWKPSDDVLARFLCLDAVGHTEVECVLAGVKDGVAEITFEGPLGGAIDGVATDIELKGKLLYDMEHQLPKTLLLAIKEQRGIGHVGTGLDVVAKMKLTVAPQPDSKLLTPDVVQAAKLPDSDVAPPLEYIADDKSFRFVYDRRWHLTRDDPDLAVMRLIDRGDLLAQCNIAATTIDTQKPLELAEFQTDVQQALGKMFTKFLRAKESSTSSGLRILQSSAEGTAEDLPIQWRYYLVNNEHGRALNIIFTMETPLADQFHDQDLPILESVEFTDSKPATSQAAKPDKQSVSR